MHRASHYSIYTPEKAPTEDPKPEKSTRKQQIQREQQNLPEWKQIATDEQGRRRLHGAFKGGFSAGYYNTVGSKEGWQPSAYRSSRKEPAAGNKYATPADYMDEEDREDLRQAVDMRMRDEPDNDISNLLATSRHSSAGNNTKAATRSILKRPDARVPEEVPSKLSGMHGAMGTGVLPTECDDLLLDDVYHVSTDLPKTQAEFEALQKSRISKPSKRKLDGIEIETLLAGVLAHSGEQESSFPSKMPRVDGDPQLLSEHIMEGRRAATGVDLAQVAARSQSSMLASKFRSSHVQVGEASELHEPARGSDVDNSKVAARSQPMSSVLASKFRSSHVQVGEASELHEPSRRPDFESAEAVAAREGRFGAQTRTVTSFMPTRMVCKRFNVPVPVKSEDEEAPSNTKEKSKELLGPAVVKSLIDSVANRSSLWNSQASTKQDKTLQEPKEPVLAKSEPRMDATPSLPDIATLKPAAQEQRTTIKQRFKNLNNLAADEDNSTASAYNPVDERDIEVHRKLQQAKQVQADKGSAFRPLFNRKKTNSEDNGAKGADAVGKRPRKHESASSMLSFEDDF